MSELLGYESIDRLYEFTNGLSPMLLIGPAGLGKARWCQDRAEEFAGHAMIKVLAHPKVADLNEYEGLHAGRFRNAWVLDLSTVFSGKTTNLNVLPALESFLKVSTNDFTRVFMHSDAQVSDSLLSVSSAVSVPLLDNEQMLSICRDRGYESDEAEFAINYAQGIPGELSSAFTMLRKRSLIFELRELLLEDKIAKMEEQIQKNVIREDIVLLKNILTSFDTGNWTLFKPHEVSFLERVKELMRNVLSYTQANPEICYVAIFHAAAHAYHGRV